MMTSSNGNIIRVTGPLCGEFTGLGEFPAQMPVTRNFDAFFDLRLNKCLSKQPRGWWSETPLWSLWRHGNGLRVPSVIEKHPALAAYCFFGNCLATLHILLRSLHHSIPWPLNTSSSLQWRHNGHDSASNDQPHDCLFNRLFRRRSKNTSKLRVTSLCAGNSPGTGEFPAQMASNAENTFENVVFKIKLFCLGLNVWLVLDPLILHHSITCGAHTIGGSNKNDCRLSAQTCPYIRFFYGYFAFYVYDTNSIFPVLIDCFTERNLVYICRLSICDGY